MLSSLHSFRLDTGLAPGRKRAYLLYTAAMKEAVAQARETDTPVVATPHPYVLALGVISIQKVKMLVLYIVAKYFTGAWIPL